MVLISSKVVRLKCSPTSRIATLNVKTRLIGVNNTNVRVVVVAFQSQPQIHYSTDRNELERLKKLAKTF